MKSTRERRLDLALLLILIAMGLHFYLARQHYNLKFGSGAASICNINSTLNCDAVAASSWSVFLGIPLAVWGFAANTALLLLVLIARFGWSDDMKATDRYTSALATLVATASIVMMGISLGFMHVYCLFCMGAYVLSFLTLFLIWTAIGGPGTGFMGDVVELFRSQKWVLFVLLAVPVSAFLANKIAIQNSGMAQIDLITAEKIAQWKTAPPQNFDETKGLTMQAGSGTPKITIVEFADFLCPHCAHAVHALESFTQAHPDVKLVFKTFPLDSSCNPALQGGPGDGTRCRIASAVMCEAKSQRGWQAHHWFFDHQEEMFGLGSGNLAVEAYCKANGIDCAPLQSCADTSEIKDLVSSMGREGGDAKISGTPTVFVNGRLLGLGQLMPVLEEAYRSSP